MASIYSWCRGSHRARAGREGYRDFRHRMSAAAKWFSGQWPLSMIYDRVPRRAPERSASLTAPAARNRALPSVPTEESGHLAMRIRCIPGAIDVRADSTGVTDLCTRVTFREASSQRSERERTESCYAPTQCHFCCEPNAFPRPSPALILYPSRVFDRTYAGISVLSLVVSWRGLAGVRRS
jgi:hypothetical protein